MIYLLTRGEYSDFTIDGVFEGPPGIDMRAAVMRFRDEYKQYPEWNDSTPDCTDTTLFERWIITTYGLTLAEHQEWWICPCELLRDGIDPEYYCKPKTHQNPYLIDAPSAQIQS
jgi:hypothetical protein